MKRIFKTILAVGMSLSLLLGASLTTLAATSGTYQSSTAATVSAKKPALSKKKVTLYVGKSQTVKLYRAKIKSVTSSKRSVATVTKSGKITAKKAGTATITYRDTKGKKYTCKVTVKNPYIAYKKITLYEGKYKTVKLVGATIKTYSSSKKTVATVNKYGKITAKKAGTAKITYKDTRGKKYYCTVTVKKPYIQETKITLYAGKYKTVTLVGATIKTYKSSNTSVATVNKYGKITAKKAGTAIITYTDTRGKKYTCTVTVKAPYIQKTELALEIGDSTTVALVGATIKSVTIDDTEIATVTKAGKITAIGAGTATITYTDTLDRTYECSVTVEPKWGIIF